MPESDALRSFDAMDSAPSADQSPENVVMRCEERKARVRIVLRAADFRIMMDVDYDLQVEGENFKGSTGSDGLVDHLVPESAEQGLLTVWPEGRGNGRPSEWELELGELEPQALEEGFADRLLNLGLVAPGSQKADDPEVQAAVDSFRYMFESFPDGEGFDGKSAQEKLEKLYSERDAGELAGGIWIALES